MVVGVHIGIFGGFDVFVCLWGFVVVVVVWCRVFLVLFWFCVVLFFFNCLSYMKGTPYIRGRGKKEQKKIFLCGTILAHVPHA